MRITRIEIKNFRSIRHVTVDLGDATVFVGPNNAGKTAILDALRIALTRRWGQRGTGFNEYDIHLANDSADTKASAGVSIDLRSDEAESGDWPAAVTEDLGDVVQIDLATDRRWVALRARFSWNEDAGAFEPTWEFLDAKRTPLAGPVARGANLQRFWRYLPVFYLGALRDAGDEFASRSSQFWRRLLDALEIPDDVEADAAQVLDQLNQRLLQADPRLTAMKNTLSGATQIAACDREGGLALRLAPLKTRELLSKAEIILRNEPDSPWLPLRRQGQGLQSLSVIFLFQVFVEHLLSELYEPGSEPILALEEPETHLHPQAVRTLWRHIAKLPGQKVVTTHSPYFVQHVPFRDLRLVRLTSNVTVVRSLPASFSASIPLLDGIEKVVDKAGRLLDYRSVSETLTVHGALDESTYRALLALCGTHPDREDLEQRLRDLKTRSSVFISDEDLQALQTQAQRMRGEIFFAERWLLVEGQSDYLIVRAVASALDYDLDQHGVSVIDAKNSGDPATFAALARALSIPWFAVLDGDKGGRDIMRSIGRRGFDEDELLQRCRPHTASDLEAQLVADGLEEELRKVLGAIGIPDADQLHGDDLADRMRSKKVAYATRIAARIRSDANVARRAPKAIQETIEQLRRSA